MSKVILNNGVDAWSFSSSQYVKAAEKNVEEYLAKEDRKLPTRAAFGRAMWLESNDTSTQMSTLPSSTIQRNTQINAI